MTLHMNAPFRWNTSLPLQDESGNTRYSLTADGFGLRRQLHVFDLSGREAVSIRQVVPSLLPRFEIETYGKPAGEVYKDMTVSPARGIMDPRGWVAEGPLGSDSLSVKTGDTVIASLHTSDGETDLELPEDAFLTALGFLLTVRCVFADQEPRRL